MARVSLTERDIDHIARVVATEVPSYIARRNPMEYKAMVAAVVDTITNRAATGKYGPTVTDVMNQNRAFSKIAGPERLDPYGKVQNAPKASQKVRDIVQSVLVDRARGIEPEIGGATHYANPNYSDLSNIKGWIGPMIEAGAKKFGIGTAVHYHGTPPGGVAAAGYDLGLPDRFSKAAEAVTVGLAKANELDRQFNPAYASPAAVKAGYTEYAQSRTPAPSSLMAKATPSPATRQVERAVATRAFDPGGILAGKAAVSLSPVSSAQASTQMPSRTTSLAPDRQMPSGKTKNGLSYSLAQPARDVVAVDRKMSYSPAAPMSVGKYSPAKSSPVSVTAKAAGGVAPAAAAAGYAQMAASRQAAPTSLAPDRQMPSGPVRSMAAPTPEQSAARLGLMAKPGLAPAPVAPSPSYTPAQRQSYTPAVAAPAPAPAQIAGPLNTPSIQAPRQQIATPAPKQNPVSKAISKIATPENIAAASLSAVGSAVAGPIGGILGGLLGKSLGKNGLPSNVNNQALSINNIGGGLAAVTQAMGGQRGTQANYSSPGGGGTVTSLGNGSYSRTSNRYGWTEVTDASGRTSASGPRGGGLLSGLLGGLMGGSQSTSGGKKK